MADDDVSEIRTERLILRDLTPDDFEAVHAYGSDPEVVRYVPWGPNTEVDTRDFIASTMACAESDPRLDFVYGVEPQDAPRLVGSIGLYLRHHDPDQAMLGYAFARDAWGRGYATESARAMVELGFEVLGLRRIWAACDPDNAASRRVLEKVGMTLEGRLRGDVVIRGEVRDSLVWGILRREWRGVRETAPRDPNRAEDP